MDNEKKKVQCSNCKIKFSHKRELQDGVLCKVCFEKVFFKKSTLSEQKQQGETGMESNLITEAQYNAKALEEKDRRIAELEAELSKAELSISYHKSKYSKDVLNGVYLQKNNDNKDWTAEQWIEEFYEFLKTGEADKIQVIDTHKPMLNELQAATVIWYLQEHFPLLPDNIDQCDVCKDLYNTYSSGYYSEKGNEHGNSFCGACDYLAPYDDEDTGE